MKMMIIVTDSTDKNALKMMRMDLIKMMIVVYSTDRNAMMMMMMIVMMIATYSIDKNAWHDHVEDVEQRTSSYSGYQGDDGDDDANYGKMKVLQFVMPDDISDVWIRFLTAAVVFQVVPFRCHL